MTRQHSSVRYCAPSSVFYRLQTPPVIYKTSKIHTTSLSSLQEGAQEKAVAHAMRHSTAQQGSAAYDKGRAERTRAAAVQVAGAFAARFETLRAYVVH